jgi:hypothetical protein
MVLLVSGIFHFAGMTHGDTDFLCSNAFRYPHTFRSALPFFLSVVKSHRLNYPSCGAVVAGSKNIFVHDYAMCDYASRLIVDTNSRNGTMVTFNAGKTKLVFP